MNFAAWQNAALQGPVRCFSLGRHALAEALRGAGVGRGHAVLLPDFICRDVLAALHAVGAEPRWYAVGADLRPSAASSAWPDARAVLAVDYFGFPQPMGPFDDYAKRTGALVIEDNAHGLFSKDDQGRSLGARADLGIFSLRKSLPVADGAMLAVSAESGLAGPLSPQLPEAGRGFAPAAGAKARLRGMPGIGSLALRAATSLTRLARRARTGHSIAPSDPASERDIPWPAAPHRGLQASLATVDVAAEIARRRMLYVEAEAVARTQGLEPVFAALPPQTCPYGFPFRATGDAPDALRRWSAARGLSLIRWPDLPSAVGAGRESDPRVWLVNFL